MTKNSSQIISQIPLLTKLERKSLTKGLNFALALLIDWAQPRFTREQAVEIMKPAFPDLHENLAEFGFDVLEEEGKVQPAGAGHKFSLACQSPDNWISATVMRTRNGIVTVDAGLDEPLSVEDRTRSYVRHLLCGDKVWISRDFGTWLLHGIRRRQSCRVICRRMSYGKESFAVPVNPQNGEVLIQVKERNFKKLDQKIFIVELDTESMGPILGDGFNNFPLLNGHVVEVLGQADDPDVEIKVALENYALPHEFSQEALAQADAYPDAVPDQEALTRVDLRDISFVTIDGEDAKDFDDAVWCTPTDNGWRLLVAIADVSHYVTAQSALDREAQTRLTSVYFPRCVIPMLPERLSNGLCSLNPKVDRCTMVCDMTIDREGNTTAYQFYPALIHSKARLTYTAVWNAINGDDSDLAGRGGSLSDISNLYSLYKAFRKARKVRGAIDFESVETEIISDPQTKKIVAIRRRDHNDAHRLIEECMLAANVCAADFIGRKKAHCLYRVHDAPAADRLAVLRDMLSGFGLKLEGGDKPGAADFEKVVEAVRSTSYGEVLQTAMLRTMQQALYSPQNIGHYGLNYPAYTHFTSPIRRYPDLLVHRTIKELLAGKKYTPKVVGDTAGLMESRAAKILEMKKRAKESDTVVGKEAGKTTAKKPRTNAWETLGMLASAAERRADDASRDVVAWLKCEYMSQFEGKSFKGIVTGIVPAGLFVTLKNLFVEGFVHVSNIGSDYWEFDEKRMRFIGESTGETYALGSAVKVIVQEVNMESRRIDFIVDQRERPQERCKRTRGSKHRFG